MQQSLDAGYGGLVYFAIDLLELDGVDVAPLPLLERKERLARLLKDPPAGIVDGEHESGDARLSGGRPVSTGWRTSSPSGSTAAICRVTAGVWVKSKCNHAEFVVVFMVGSGRVTPVCSRTPPRGVALARLLRTDAGLMICSFDSWLATRTRLLKWDFAYVTFPFFLTQITVYSLAG